MVVIRFSFSQRLAELFSVVISRSGGGTAVFAAEGEDLRPKVMSQLKNALQPSLAEVEVLWTGVAEDRNAAEQKQEPELETKPTLLGYMKPKPPRPMEATEKKLSRFSQAPAQIPPIYDGTRLLVYKLFHPESGVPKSVKITALTPDGPLSVEIPIEEKSYLNGDFVHQMAARKRIQDLEEMIIEEGPESKIGKKDVENAIVELGLKFKLASKHTSFVGVDEKKPGEEAELVMNTR